MAQFAFRINYTGDFPIGMIFVIKFQSDYHRSTLNDSVPCLCEYSATEHKRKFSQILYTKNLEYSIIPVPNPMVRYHPMTRYLWLRKIGNMIPVWRYRTNFKTQLFVYLRQHSVH